MAAANSTLRPLSLGELLDRSFFLYREHFLLFVGIIAVPTLVSLAFQLVGVAINPTGMKFSGLGIAWTILNWVIVLPIYATTHGATVLAVSKVHFGQSTTVGESLSGIMGRVLGISFILFGIWMGVGIGFVLLIVPGIILWLMWSLAIPVTVLEDTGLADTARRSSELTKGSRWRILLICFLFVVLFYIMFLVFLTPLGVALSFYMRTHARHLGFPLWYLIGVPVGTFLSSCLTGPLLSIALTLVYYDQKVRREAYDLQLMMTNLDAAQAATPIPPSLPTPGIT